jgi:integrase
MPRRPLTKTLVDSFKKTGRDYVVWDANAPGFGVRVSAGGSKSYIQMYRAGRGRGAQLRKVTIGKTTDLTLSEARNIATRHRGDVARGDDPAGRAARKRREMTLKEAADRYLQEHVLVHNKPSWAKQIELLLKVHILREFGSTRLSDITRGAVIKWHAQKPAGHYGTNRCLAILRKILTIAQRDWCVISSNPASGVRLHREAPRDRFFSDDEIAAIGSWLAKSESGAEGPHFILATRLLLLTGMRLGEVMSLRWLDVDLPQNIIRLRDSKSGARSVALNPEIVAYLAESKNRGEFVVGTKGGAAALTKGSYHAFWRRLVSNTGLTDARPHDFRHTVATLGAMGGANAFVLRDLLGHKTIAITSGYVARTIDPVRSVSNAIGRHIGSAVSPLSDHSSELIVLGRRANR